MGKFVIHPVATGIKFTLKAENGETIATSEVYSGMAACRRGVESVRKCAAVGRIELQTEEGFSCLPNPKFELYNDRTGAFRFRLRSRNGKIIAVSEGYTSKAACLAGIESVIANAPEAGQILL